MRARAAAPFGAMYVGPAWSWIKRRIKKAINTVFDVRITINFLSGAVNPYFSS